MNSFDIAEKDEHGDTALHHAVLSGDRKLVKLLLEAGTDVSCCNKDGKCPLSLAVQEAKPSLIRLMLMSIKYDKHRAKIATRALSLVDYYANSLISSDLEWETPGQKPEGKRPSPKRLLTARLLVTRGIKILLNAGANPNAADKFGSPILHNYCFDETIPIMEHLLENGAQTNLTGSFGRSALVSAICSGNEAAARLLLEYGADPNPKYCDTSPLIIASSTCSPELVACLIKAGAEVNAKDKYGHTPLMNALKHRTSCNEMINTLLYAGAENSAADYLGFTVSDHAMSRVVQSGKEVQGIAINQHDLEFTQAASQGNNFFFAGNSITSISRKILTNALALAAYEGHLSFCQFLITHGADPNGFDIFGHRPLAEAARNANSEVMKLLMTYGAAVDGHGIGGGGQTSLLVVCLPFGDKIFQERRLSSVELLLKYGADLETRDDFGQSPLRQAVISGIDRQLVGLLLKHGARPDLPDDHGDTPLSLAEKYHPKMLPLFLNRVPAGTN